MGNIASLPYSGSPETFENVSIGTFTYASFPPGWSDVAQVDPASTAPKPSAVVIQTTDAFGNSTQALATFPAITLSQGIYRPIEPSTFYKTSADVRIDQTSETDPSKLVEDPNNPGFLLCGCPVGYENLVDWPMQVTLANIVDTTDPSDAPTVGLIASAETHTWHLYAGTQNVLADVDLGIHVMKGVWYNLETDFNADTGALHGTVTDISSGLVLADKMAFVNDPKYGRYDPAVDGVFNSESYNEGEHSLYVSSDPSLTRPGLAVIDNIDVPDCAGAVSGSGYDLPAKAWDGLAFEHG